MLNDPTEFRKRFALRKQGKMPYKNGLPVYKDGTDGENVVDSIIREEGFLSRPTNIGDGKQTIGSGLTKKKWIDAYYKKGKWTREDNRAAVVEEIDGIVKHLKRVVPNYDNLPTPMQDTLIDIQYNTGALNKKKSPNFMRMLERGEYEKASRAMNWGWKQYDQFPGLKQRNIRRQDKWTQGLKEMEQGPANPKILQRVIEQAPVYTPPVIKPASNITYDEYYTTPIAPQKVSIHSSAQSPSYVIPIPDVAQLYNEFWGNPQLNPVK